MADQPYFPIYYRDFEHGTKYFTYAMKGVYFELLCDQWDLTILTEEHFDHKKRLVSEEISGQNFTKILEKFSKVNGGFQNKRMEKTRRYVGQLRKKRSEAGKLGGFHRHSKIESKGVANDVANDEQKTSLLSPSPSPSSNPNSNPNSGVFKRPQNPETLDPLRRKEWPTFFKLTEARKKFAMEVGIEDPEKVWKHWKSWVKANGVLKSDWAAAWEAWCLDEKTKKTNPGDRYEPEGI